VLNLGFTEIMLVMIVAIVVVGPDRLPILLGWLGRQYGKLRSASEELRQAFVLEADRVETDKRTEHLRHRRDEARRRIEAARAKAEEDASSPVPRQSVGPTPSAEEAPE
jgi:sec-independent protein translocase protein TatB